MGECHGAAFSLLDPARSAGYDEKSRSLVGLFGAGAGLGQITESRIVADYILENGDYSPTLLDILDAVQRSESMDAEQRVQYESSGEVLPLAEFRRQAAAARTAEENLTRAQEKLDSRLAELDAEQQRLQADEAQKREDWQAVPADAASVKRKRAAFEAWKDAHGKYEKFVNNRAADETSARTDYEASTRQNQDALRVANDRMNGHYVRLASLFRDDVAAMEHARDVQLTRTDARRRYDAAAQRIDELMDTETERPDGQTDTATKRPAQYTIQQGGPNDGRAEAGGEAETEDHRAGRGLLDGGWEVYGLEADGRGRSKDRGSESPSGGVLPQTGVDGRTVRRDGGRFLTEPRKRLTQAGVTDFGLSVTEDHQAFSDALNRMRAENDNGASVDPQSVETLAGALAFANPEWTAGGAVQPSGNIVAVFKNKIRDKRENAGLDILFHAISIGGDRLDCYGIFLVNTYAQGGMVPVARVAYARGINPEMDAYIDYKREQGNPNFATDPDIYFMKLRAGARYEDLVDDYVNGRYHQYTPEELDALPLMSYDEAEAYRDSLLEQERRQGDYAGAVQELGEAAQLEDAAGAEDVDRAAVDAKMRAARAGGAEAAQEAAGAAAGKGQGNDASEAQTTVTEAQRPSWADVDAGAQARAVSLGERLGVPVVFEQMPEGFTGQYEDGVIHIATRLPAGEAPELTVLRHELTHYLEGSAEYGALSDYVVQLAQRLNPQLNVNRVLEGLAEEYATRGVELSPDGARREFVARFVQDKLLRDETAIDRLVRERSGVAGRVLNWIEYRIARLKLRGQNSAEARALLEAERLYAKAFARAGTRPELTDDGAQYSISDQPEGRSEAEPYPITTADVAAIQSIGRKSVNDFSGDEIRTAEPFARRYWRELGVKSPFFRAWFGDWRANDRTPVRPVRVAGADAPKSGRAINADTGRPISWGHTLRGETYAHGTKSALESIKGIDRIIETAVLLDTVAVKSISKSKLPGTAFMHSLYSLVDNGGGLTLYRLFAEESIPTKGGEPFTRAYELKEIKEVATTPDSVLSVSEGLTDGAPATTYTVADLFAFVKKNVLDFQPKPVHPALLNEDGTPKVFYHGTGSEFYEFSTEQIGAREGSFFFAENPEDAAGYGRNVMPVYLSAQNLADYDAQPSEFYRLENKRAQVAYLKERGYDGWYADMDSDGWGEISVFSPEQIKSATDNAGTFDGRNADIRYSLNGLTWDEMVARYGAKPAGAEPRTRDEAVPERAGDEQRVSDFLRSFVESDKATDEMVAQVRAAVENGDNRKPYANILTEKYREKRRVQSLRQTAWMCSSINWI